MMNYESPKQKEYNRMFNKLMEEMGFKPRRRKKSHQWWESPWIDYDDPRNRYYEKK
jgi:hypothetical protein